MGNLKNQLAGTRLIIQESLQGIPKLTAVILLVSLCANFVLFNQGDLSHTVTSSYAYLDGHIFDFYDFNQKVVKVNDYFPLIYVIFAVWMMPLKLFGLMTPPELRESLYLSPLEIGWAKLLLLATSIAIWIVINSISKLLFESDREKRRNISLFFILSPLAMFVVMAFSQYDVFGILFALLGYYSYLKNRTSLFVFYFAVAISLKFFALVIFVPLLILKYKSLIKIPFYFVLSLSGVLLAYFVYKPSAGFQAGAFRLLTAQAGSSGGKELTALVLMVFVVGGFFLWRYRPSELNIGPISVFTSIVSFGLMLHMVSWNPQWLLWLVPFFSFAIGYLHNPRRYLVFDSLSFVAAIWVFVDKWPWNVDSSMVMNGMLRNHISLPKFGLSAIYSPVLFDVMWAVVMFYFLSPLVFFLYEKLIGIPKRDLSKPIPNWIWDIRALTEPLIWITPSVLSIVGTTMFAVQAF